MRMFRNLHQRSRGTTRLSIIPYSNLAVITTRGDMMRLVSVIVNVSDTYTMSLVDRIGFFVGPEIPSDEVGTDSEYEVVGIDGVPFRAFNFICFDCFFFVVLTLLILSDFNQSVFSRFFATPRHMSPTQPICLSPQRV